MIRFVAVFALSLRVPVAAETDSPWLDWVAANSPNGFDITPDGTIWINIAEVGEVDDYAIRAEDLQEARQSTQATHSFWVRGYHIKNTKVAYRESKVRFSLDCKRETIGRSLAVFYDKDGRVLYQLGSERMNYIVPGTYGAEYYRLLCLVG